MATITFSFPNSNVLDSKRQAERQISLERFEYSRAPRPAAVAVL